MKAPATLSLFGAGLVVIFGASYALAAAITPDAPAEPAIHQPTEHPEEHS
ncbi:hypothetical protein MN032_17440 [Agromyces atrinae]|uniref:DUF2613 family protein n=1 Tax=Agromyces atrinae TaxID=592376 RepID=A0A852S8E0_9MICO|nr:hypothetical protein [Agromyces atrinae]MCI2959471.1 hypothetical protein [Agromyces atrinae]NYD68672.1 hypothetical protein [Agromyces atrinae]